MKLRQLILAVYVPLLTLPLQVEGRSIYRPDDDSVPTITTRWCDETDCTKTYTLRHSSLEAKPLFEQFDEEYFNEHLLPAGPITYRNDEKRSVDGAVLQEYLEQLVTEVLQDRKRQDRFNRKHNRKRYRRFTNFTVIKERDYNPRTHAGLIVLKCNDYPFVIKLFMETPESFVRPFSKGLEPICFFMMGGGINRYLAGFSRVKNAYAIQEIIEADPFLKAILSTTRKWFWRPEQSRWFELEGHNFGPATYHIKLPSIYAIVCDGIESDYTLKLTNKANRKLGIKLSRTIGIRVDPHINNFMTEKGSHLIVLVDTEHFPTMVGLREPILFENYTEWYSQLIKKCSHDSFFRLKSERRARHEPNYQQILVC